MLFFLLFLISSLFLYSVTFSILGIVIVSHVGDKSVLIKISVFKDYIFGKS